MANLEALRVKWRIWFNLLDMNKDGKLTMDDWVFVGDKFVQSQKLNDDDATRVRKIFAEFAELVFGIGSKPGSSHELNEERFVSNVERFYNHDPNEAKRIAHEIYGKFCEIADQNKDGFLSESELIAMNHAIGFEDDNSREIFRQLGGTSGCVGVSFNVFQDYCVEFAFGDGTTKAIHYDELFPGGK